MVLKAWGADTHTNTHTYMHSRLMCHYLICLMFLGDVVDEDYMPHSKNTHAGFQQSPAVIQECYTAQEAIGDSLPGYSFRNRSGVRIHCGPQIRIGALMLIWNLRMLVKTES